MDTSQTVAERIHSLRDILNGHSRLYHGSGTPVITDSDYDSLFSELVALERAHPEMADVNSPTSRVGCESTSGFSKVKHASKMLSLDNAFSAVDLIYALGGGSSVFVEPKIDGCSLELVYAEGRLVSAVTRGDGSVGDDVTANARTIASLPLVLNTRASLRVRGEVYMTFSAFNRLNVDLEQSGDDLMANPRNAAAGTLKLKDAREVAKRQLSFAAYGTPDTIEGVETQEELIEFLRRIGFVSVTNLPLTQPTVLPNFAAVLDGKATIETTLTAMDHYRKQLDLPTDGLVFKINSLALQRALGDGTRAPRWAVAFKFPPEQKQTKLVSIAVTVGKTGKLTPVASLDPVSLSGTVVTYASLCNANEIKRLGVNIGDIVFVEKSAEIIPKVMGVQCKMSPGIWAMPDACPSCGHAVSQPDGYVDYFCVNAQCPDQVLARLRHATGKSALDIDGCGDAAVRELMRHGVTNLVDLFSVKDLGFFKPATRKKFKEGIELAKAQPLWRKIHALGIDGIGRTVSQEIAGRWNSLYAVFDDLPELKRVIGESNYQSFTSWFERNADDIEKLAACGFLFEGESLAGPLTGKSFVITGTLVSGLRDEVAARIEEAGGLVKSAVSRRVSFLVAGSDCGRVKLEAAAKVGTAVITEEQLYEMIGIPMPIASVTVDPTREF